MEFKDWINDKYILWRGNSRSTITAFADWVGVSQSLMTHWMNGKMIPRDPSNIAKLVVCFGIKTYEILGYYIPEGETGIVIHVVRGDVPLDQVQNIFDQAKDKAKTITDPDESLNTYIKILTDSGMNVYKVSLKYPLEKSKNEIVDPIEDQSIDLSTLPPALRNLLLIATREVADKLTESKIDPSSPEGELLAVSIMEKHGFKWSITDIPGNSG